MGLMLRLLALTSGQKVIWLVIQDQKNGYLLLTSPSLPGFSLMLRPEDTKSATALTASIEGPLKTFIEAEYRAYRAKDGQKHVQMAGIFRASEHKILAGYCAA